MDNVMERTRLLDYLPAFMRQFLEMQEITQAEDAEMDEINARISRIFDNAFIESCDGYGIQKYEKLLGIHAVPQDTLEWRRNRVLARWNYYQLFTYNVLLRKLDTLCGAGNYTVSGNLDGYQLSIGVMQEFTGQIDEVEKLLEKMLPMNISYEVYEEHPVTGNVYVGAMLQEAEIVNIRQVM